MSHTPETPSQTAGPYVHIGCTPNASGIPIYQGDLGSSMKTGPVQGQEITLRGTVFDGAGEPLRDALIEIWQADAAGLFRSVNETRGSCDPNFLGWGRAATDMATGAFQFDTVKPGAVPWHDGQMQAPHITMWIAARGINIGLHTRVYFEDETANAMDPILTQIRPSDRAVTLIAQKMDVDSYQLDIHLQGPNETVFFDI